MRNRLRTLVPAGAMAALLAAGCADDPDPPFAPTGTGTVSGRLFFDADNNGLFTPVGGDTALRAVTVELRERGSSRVLATTTTDDEGEFSFSAPPGTHDVFVAADEATVGDLVFCVNPMRASVYIGEQAFLPVVAKRGCVIRIAEAKAKAQGEPITIAGVITAAQGTFRNDNAYIQDASGGLLVFGLPTSLGLQLGDSVEMSGTLATFSTELELVDPTVAPNVKRGATLPAPKVLTTTQLAAIGPTHADAGRLVTVRRVTVGAFTAGGGRNASIDDGSGAAVLRLDGNVLTAIPTSTFQAGKCYDITGVVGIFNNGSQLKPRVRSDVAEVPCS